jgi:thymidylate kinase
VTQKREKPLYLDMDPDEALARFMQTDPDQLKRRLDKKKAPPKRGQVVEEKVKPKPKP